MRLGIDFGTTRTVVAAVDRGNYPVVHFQLGDGDSRAWYPSLIAARPGSPPAFGFDAEAAAGRPTWRLLRSIKRLLADTAPDTLVWIGQSRFPALDLLTDFLCRLKKDLRERSNLDLRDNEKLEAYVAAPANSNSNQRFITIEAFRRAGFQVLGMMNEPSAAGIEYAHGHGAKQPLRRELLVVYDLGGGTFDASVISLKGDFYEVLASDGLARVGGDDFDEILKELALERLGKPELEPEVEYALVDLCQRVKEALHPNTRRILLDVSQLIPGAQTVSIPIGEFCERCQPLVEKTIESVETAVGAAGAGQEGDPWSEITAVYLVGGSSDLPVVSRTLRERYPRRVRRSTYPFAATAIGLAVSADATRRHTLKERFSRYFGVWREADSGRRVVFDPIFTRETPLPQRGEPDLISTRLYNPAHNIGCFRYLECSRLDARGEPAGDVTPWDAVLFPFDQELQRNDGLEKIEVRRRPEVTAHVIEELYRCDSRGIIEVTMADRTTGYSRSYRLRRKR